MYIAHQLRISQAEVLSFSLSEFADWRAYFKYTKELHKPKRRQ